MLYILIQILQRAKGLPVRNNYMLPNCQPGNEQYQSMIIFTNLQQTVGYHPHIAQAFLDQVVKNFTLEQGNAFFLLQFLSLWFQFRLRKVKYLF